jgi:hypothetical protein
MSRANALAERRPGAGARMASTGANQNCAHGIALVCRSADLLACALAELCRPGRLYSLFCRGPVTEEGFTDPVRPFPSPDPFVWSIRLATGFFTPRLGISADRDRLIRHCDRAFRERSRRFRRNVTDGFRWRTGT